MDNITYLGCGIGFRREIESDILNNCHNIDFLEIITDNYINIPVQQEKLKLLVEKFKIIPHGINLSIASNRMDQIYLRDIKEICKIIRAPYYSEHLCFSKIPGICSGHLLPIWFNDEYLVKVIANINFVQDFLEMPLVIENIAYSIEMPESHMSQEQFFKYMVEGTGCGILLDLANLHANSYNFQFDPYKFLDKFPLDNVVQIHLAGGYYNTKKKLIDSHSFPVHNETWDLLKYTLQKTQVKAVLLEHDDNFPKNFDALLNQLNYARTIIKNAAQNDQT